MRLTLLAVVLTITALADGPVNGTPTLTRLAPVADHVDPCGSRPSDWFTTSATYSGVVHRFVVETGEYRGTARVEATLRDTWVTVRILPHTTNTMEWSFHTVPAEISFTWPRTGPTGGLSHPDCRPEDHRHVTSAHFSQFRGDYVYQGRVARH
ncbi:hypothetical protein ACFYY8_24810 [Streptosporangium sp. NPDC001559]|uniref:hypothetical protein n=1 Tax=Streptosporangium sp. NPDC001559 TaxID=3366187 RepID=UPI0036EDB1A6